MLKKQTNILITFTSHSDKSSNYTIISGLLCNEVLFKMKDSNLFRIFFYFQGSKFVKFMCLCTNRAHSRSSNKALHIQRHCRVLRLRRNFIEINFRNSEFCVSLHTLLPISCARSRQPPRSAPVFTSAYGYLQVTADSGRDYFFK